MWRPLALGGLVVTLSILLASIFYVPWLIFVGSPVRERNTVPFSVRSGEGVTEISQHLAEQKINTHPLLLQMYTSLIGASHTLKAGEYELHKGESIQEVVRVLTTGVPTPEWSLRFIEGWSLEEMAQYLTQEKIFTQEQFDAALTDPECRSTLATHSDLIADIPPQASLEGYLFPDTYRIFKDARVCDLLSKMVKILDQRFSQDLRDETARQRKTIRDILTMASIVEREVPSARDRAMVAGIFWKRLALGIPLQSDATINYITGKYRTQQTAADLGIDSPYNTYQHKGLPPGPIGNPGLDAIRATLYPQESPYLYFLSRPTGETIFSRTYEEHLANKARYLP